MIIKLEELNRHPLLEDFWDNHLNKMVDSVFKDKQFVFVDIHFHNGVPSYVVMDDDGKRIGVIVEIQYNGEPLYFLPAESEGKPDSSNEYFINGYTKIGYPVLSIGVNMYTNDCLDTNGANSNKRVYVGEDPNYWAVLKDENSDNKLYVFYPNIRYLKNLK